jgi:cell division transport system ATP-binding protein
MGSLRARRFEVDPGVPVVRLLRVSRFYRADRPALFDISLEVYRGEFLYVAGASGAGKSTLLRLLHLAESPDTGTILFSGHDVTSLKRSAISIMRRSMGMVFQDFRLVEDLSVAANVSLPLEIAGMSGREIARRTDEMLERVGLDGRGAELSGGLSGGEQQRVAIARALVGRPDLVLADEPTGNLDAYSADLALDLLESVASAGATVILATHDRLLMSARPHRVVALDRGRLVGASPSGSRRRRAHRADDTIETEMIETG